MKDFIKQYDKDHVTQRLYVHWDVSTQCNFKCTYCYAMKDYGTEWGKLDTWPRQKLVINSIGRSQLPVFLGLLGGEPTLHPHYDELIHRCHDVISRHEQGRLYVVTNGSSPESFLKSHKFYDNMYFLFSFHTEYEGKYGKDFKTLINNIKIAANRGFRCKVNIMLHHDERFWSKIHKFVDSVEKIPGIELHPHFLYADGDVHNVHEYNDKFYTEFIRFKDYPEYLTFEDSSGSKEMFNDYTVFNDNKTNFKGWSCWNNNYEISYDGYVHKVCFPVRTNLVIKPYYFKQMTEIKPVICPHSQCGCDGLLKIYKQCDK